MQTPPNRTTRLDRDQVAQTALRLLDDVGLDGLTVRRLAAALGVQGPALYWHFANKQDLLDLMAHAMTQPWLESVPVSGVGRPWDDWLTDVGRSYRTLLLAHRDGARLVAGTRPLPDSLPLIDRCIAAFEASSGCGPGQALQSLTAITAFVRGFVLDEHAALVRAQGEPMPQPRAEGTQATGRTTRPVPHLDAAMDLINSPNGDGTFEYGLHVIVDGIRIALAKASSPQSEEPVE
jgi:TetR/AcrR family tetracycline transcriptional repressor